MGGEQNQKTKFSWFVIHSEGLKGRLGYSTGLRQEEHKGECQIQFPRDYKPPDVLTRNGLENATLKGLLCSYLNQIRLSELKATSQDSDTPKYILTTKREGKKIKK